MKTKSLLINVFAFSLLMPAMVKAQSLPVNTPILEDYYRRQQLLGNVDSSISFTIRPLSTSSVIKLQSFDLDSASHGGQFLNLMGMFLLTKN